MADIPKETREAPESADVPLGSGDALPAQVGRVAHDLNNVLAVVTGYAGIILADLAPDDPIRAEVEQIVAAAQRASGLAARLLVRCREEARRDPSFGREAAMAPPAADEARGAGATPGEWGTVLLVDEDDETRALTRDALLECGFQVVQASSAGDAILASEFYPDTVHVLLAETRLQHMSGEELAARIRQDRPDVDVVLTSDVLPPSAGSPEGAVLGKPVTTAAIRHKLAHVIARHALTRCARRWPRTIGHAGRLERHRSS